MDEFELFFIIVAILSGLTFPLHSICLKDETLGHGGLRLLTHKKEKLNFANYIYVGCANAVIRLL